MRPIFIFSLPRSGSTLAQRIISAHDAVDTHSEPWLLLPFCYAMRREGSYAEYSHADAVTFVQEFCDHLPGGAADYYAAISDATRQLYAKACRKSGAIYFLDKTPRYHLIVDEIMTMFPDGKFIFLWRNPLAVVSSILETWGRGGWNLYRFEIDLYEGLERLVSVYKRNAQRCCAVRYEDLIESPDLEIKKIFDYLGLEVDATVADRFKDVKLTGKIGDKAGYARYKALTSEPLGKWRLHLATPLRKYWCANYLKWIGPERLSMMGYDVEQLQADLSGTRIPLTGWGRGALDATQAAMGAIFRWIEPYLLRDKINKLPKRRIYIHR